MDSPTSGSSSTNRTISEYKKAQIASMRRYGASIASIAKQSGLPYYTVRNFVRDNHDAIFNEEI